MAYESGMHQYKKVKEMYYSEGLEGEGKAKEASIPKFSRSTYFAFEGEFWSDELDDYTFLIEDYCDVPEKWLGEEVPAKKNQKVQVENDEK